MVKFKLGLYVAKQRFGVFLALADKHHKVHFSEGFEIEGIADVEMHGLRVGTCPLGGILNIVVVAESVRCLDMERGAVCMLPGFLIIAIMGEIVVEETAIIGEEILYSFLLLCGRFLDGHDGAWAFAIILLRI